MKTAGAVPESVAGAHPAEGSPNLSGMCIRVEGAQVLRQAGDTRPPSRRNREARSQASGPGRWRRGGAGSSPTWVPPTVAARAAGRGSSPNVGCGPSRRSSIWASSATDPNGGRSHRGGFVVASAGSAILRRRREAFVVSKGPYTETWGPERFGDPCRDCAFEWSLTSEQAIASVLGTPDAYERLIGSADGSLRHPGPRLDRGRVRLPRGRQLAHLGPVARWGGPGGRGTCAGLRGEIARRRALLRAGAGGRRPVATTAGDAPVARGGHRCVGAPRRPGPREPWPAIGQRRRPEQRARCLSPRVGHRPHTRGTTGAPSLSS